MKITNELIRKWNPCYDPQIKGISDDESLGVLEWVEKYRTIIPAEDIIWGLCRNDFFTDRELRLFAVWCAMQALKLVYPDQRSVDACNVAERYANGQATLDELAAARAAASDAAWDAAWAAASAAALAAARAAAWAAASAAARAAAWAAASAAAMAAASPAARAAQLNYLTNLLKEKHEH